MFKTLNQTQFSFSSYLGTPVQFIFHTCRSSLLVQQQKLDRGHIYSLIFTPSPGLLLLVYLSGFTLQTTTYLTLLSLKLKTSTFLSVLRPYDGTKETQTFNSPKHKKGRIRSNLYYYQGFFLLNIITVVILTREIVSQNENDVT